MQQLTLEDIQSTDTDSDICGAETSAGGSCQKEPNRPDGRCYFHTEIEDQRARAGRPCQIETKREDVLEAAREGYTIKKCAEEVGIGYSTIVDWLDERPTFAWEFRLERPKEARRSSKGSERLTVQCDQCGVKIERPKWQVESGEHNYCTHECHKAWMSENRVGEAHPDYQGGRNHTPTGPRWRSQRKKALERDGFECQACGMSREEHYDQYEIDLHVHHIEPRRTFDDLERANRLGNLVTLCVPCHGVYEGAFLSPVHRPSDD